MGPGFFDCILRLTCAGLLGALVGIDREYRSKGAGTRTHFLVCLGSALIMLVSKYGFSDIETGQDPSRMAAQVVSGIGFLGAGTIILQKQYVRGLTTAAGLWAVCGIGLAVGAGLYALATAATLLTLAGLELMKVVVRYLGGSSRTFQMVCAVESMERLDSLIAELASSKYRIDSYSLSRITSKSMRVTMSVKTLDNKRSGDHLVTFVHQMPGVTLEKFE